MTDSVGYGHAGFASYGRQLLPPSSTSCDPEFHRRHRLIDHVNHGQSILRGVKQDVHPGRTATPL